MAVLLGASKQLTKLLHLHPSHRAERTISEAELETLRERRGKKRESVKGKRSEDVVKARGRRN
jgi:hypothetical protein